MALFNIQKSVPKVNTDIVSLIRRRMLQVWVHSYIYYEMDDNVISDETWSKWAMELVDLIKKYPKEFKTIKHWDVFKDFDGSTGYHLVDKATPNLISKAYLLTGRLGKE